MVDFTIETIAEIQISLQSQSQRWHRSQRALSMLVPYNGTIAARNDRCARCDHLEIIPCAIVVTASAEIFLQLKTPWLTIYIFF